MGIGRAIKTAIHNGIRAYLAQYVETHVECQVVSYDADTNLANLQPCIEVMRTFDPNNLQTIRMPPINDVPVQLYGSGDLLTNLAPVAGSYGELHVSKRRFDGWLHKGGVVAPTSAIMFDASWGVFTPGIYTLVVDGNNGKLQSPILTDRIGFRNRAGTYYMYLHDNDTASIQATQLSVNGNFTVDE